MARRKEILNEAHLRKRVRETHGVVRKMAWPGRRGAPDDFVGWPHKSRFALVELKEETQGWALQPHQAREHQVLMACGVPVVVLRSIAEIDAWVERMTK